MNRLTSDLQAACGADKVSEVLDFLEGASESFASLDEIARALKKEVYWTNPKLMWNKCKTHLRVLKADASEITLEKESWNAIRDSVFHDTPMWAHIAAVRKPPSAEQLDALVGQWKAVMEPARKKENMVAPATLNYPHLRQYNEEIKSEAPTQKSTKSAPQAKVNVVEAAVATASSTRPRKTKRDGGFQKSASVELAPAGASNSNNAQQEVPQGLHLCEKHKMFGVRANYCQGKGCQWYPLIDPWGEKKGWEKLDIQVPFRGNGRGARGPWRGGGGGRPPYNKGYVNAVNGSEAGSSQPPASENMTGAPTPGTTGRSQ